MEATGRLISIPGGAAVHRYRRQYPHSRQADPAAHDLGVNMFVLLAGDLWRRIIPAMNFLIQIPSGTGSG